MFILEPVSQINHSCADSMLNPCPHKGCIIVLSDTLTNTNVHVCIQAATGHVSGPIRRVGMVRQVGAFISSSICLHNQPWVCSLLYRCVASLHLLTYSSLLSVLLCNRCSVLVIMLLCTGPCPPATNPDPPNEHTDKHAPRSL